MTEYESILYSVENRIARITMNRPEKRNALDESLRTGIVAALKAAERDDDVTVILIHGAGEGFCAGYDLTAGRYRPAEHVSAKWFDEITDQTQRVLLASWMTIWDLLKPVVAMVHGACLAGGSEMMSMCDIVFAADDARIGHPAMRNMSSPDTLYFPWRMPMARARYHQLTGNSVTGKEAAEIGWVTKSFPAEDLEEMTMRELRGIASIPPDMLAINKLRLNQTYDIMGFRTAMNTGGQWHQFNRDRRPSGNDFTDVARRDGLKAALEARDSAFLKEGLL